MKYESKLLHLNLYSLEQLNLENQQGWRTVAVLPWDGKFVFKALLERAIPEVVKIETIDAKAFSDLIYVSDVLPPDGDRGGVV